MALCPIVTNLPTQYKIIGSLAGVPVLYFTNPTRRKHVEDLILREESIDFSLERRIVNERNIHLPWESPQRSEAGGQALAILQALERAAHCSVNYLGKTRTYNHESYIFDLQDYNDRSELLNSKTFVKIATGCEGFPFLEFNRGMLSVQLPLPQRDRTFPKVDNPAWIGNSRQQILYPVGVNSDSVLETVPVDQGFSHVLITGGTRSGKSVATQSAIQFLVRRHTPFEFGFSIIEVKNSPTFRPAEWERYPHCVTQVANTHETGIRVLLWYLAESHRRGKELQEWKCDTLDQYNARAPQSLPHLFCFIDEALSYLDVNSAPPAYRALFVGILSELAVKSASVGIHLVLLVQRCGASEGDPFYHATTLRSNVGALRICFKVQTSQDGLIALNISDDEAQHEPLAGEAAHLLSFGDGIFRSAETSDLIRFQSLTPIAPSKEPPFNGGGIEIGSDAEWDELPPISDEVIDCYIPQRGKTRQMQGSQTEQASRTNEEGVRLYQAYRALRQPQDGSKPMSMSKALQQLGNLGSDGGAAYIEWKNRLKDALLSNLADWLSDLVDLPDEEVLKLIWSATAKDANDLLTAIKKIRK